MGIQNVNLFKPPGGAPLDIGARQQALTQEQAIAAALIAQSMKEQPGTHTVAAGNPFGGQVPNWGDPLSSIIENYQGKKELEELNKKQAALAEETQRTTQQDIAHALALREGIGGMAPGSGEEPPAAPIPGNYNSYVKALVGSTVPEVRKLGEKAVEKMITPQDLAQYSDKYTTGGLDTAAKTGRFDTLKTKPKIETFEGASRALDTDTGLPISAPQAINEYNPMALNSLGIATQTSKVTGRETAPGPQGDVTTQKTFENLDAAAQIKLVEAGVKVWEQNQSNLATISQAREEMKQIPEQEFGFFGPAKTVIGKVGEALGFQGLTSTSSKESLEAVLGNLTLQKVRALAPVTEQDLIEIKKIIGSTGMTKRSMERVMDIMQNATEAEMKRHVNQVKTVAERSSNPDQFLRAYTPEYHPSVTPAAEPPRKTIKFGDMQ